MNNNYLIIMAGGIGSRFWPFSRTRKPKQFLDFFGTGRTLLQMTIDRYCSLVPKQNILIVTNEAYRDLIMEQVPDLKPTQILTEPCRRNTAPCIAYATAHILNKTNNANIIVAASDHLITDQNTFRQTIEQGLDYINSHNDILTLGMKPTRAETGYGYIKVEPTDEPIKPVGAFREKPDLATAQAYLKDGNYLWNSGMFMFNLQTITQAFRTFLPDVWKEFEQGMSLMATPQESTYIKEHFPLCPNISIDYGIMEKADNVRVLPADFGWSDLGNWASLYDLSDKDSEDNVSIHSKALFFDSKCNLVTLESGKLAVIEGLEGYIVAENEGVLLICRRQSEQEIKKMVEKVQDTYSEMYS